MNALKISTITLSMFIAMVSRANEPKRIEVRYVQAVIWPKTFDATPDNKMNIYTGTRSTNIVLAGDMTNLAPIQLYTRAFGTNTPELVWVNEARVLRYDTMHTNYFVPYFYMSGEMRRETNFTSRLCDGDIVFFTETVD